MPKVISEDDLLKSTEIVDIDSIQPHPRNPRIGDEELIKKSIEYHGQFRAIGVSIDNYILFGNHTWLGMKLAGKTRVLIHRLPFGHNDPQAIKILLADNRSSDGSDYDLGILRLVLEEAREADDGLVGSLYSDDYLLKMIAKEARELETDPDDIPATPRDPLTKLGDIWMLGKHLLICGDSTKSETYEKIIAPEEKPSIMWTDPPYGISLLMDFEEAKRMNHRTDQKVVTNDDIEGEELIEFLRSFLTICVSKLERSSSVYMCSPPGPTSLIFGSVLEEMGILRQIIIWAKDQLVFGRSDYHYQHEIIFYGWTRGDKHFFTDDRTQTSLWEIARPKRSDQHPTMKPVEMVTRALLNSSTAGQIILDPFAGSGTAIIAAQMNHRVARCIEIDPAYCDVACRRFQEATGVNPLLLRTGEQYDFTTENNAAAIV